jgi:hypothetical protein
MGTGGAGEVMPVRAAFVNPLGNLLLSPNELIGINTGLPQNGPQRPFR